MLSDFCFQSCRNISCSEPGFAFTVPKPLRFSNSVTLPRSQGITKTGRMDFQAPGLSWSNQTSPAQCRSPRPCRLLQSSGSNTHCPWPLHCPRLVLELVTTGALQTQLKHFKTFLLLLPPAAAAAERHRNANLTAPGQSPKSQPQHFAIHPQHSHYLHEVSMCSPFPDPSLWGSLCPNDSDQVRATTKHLESLSTTSLCLFEIKPFLPCPSAFPWQIGLWMLTLPTKHYIPKVRKGEPKLGQNQ